jgi:hypothetical protein
MSFIHVLHTACYFGQTLKWVSCAKCVSVVISYVACRNLSIGSARNSGRLAGLLTRLRPLFMVTELTNVTYLQLIKLWPHETSFFHLYFLTFLVF